MNLDVYKSSTVQLGFLYECNKWNENSSSQIYRLILARLNFLKTNHENWKNYKLCSGFLYLK